MKLHPRQHAFSAAVGGLENWFRDPFGHVPSVGLFLEHFPDLFQEESARRIPVDILEDQEAFHLEFELAGVKREEVKVELEENTLTVSAQKRIPRAGEESVVQWNRAVSIPKGVLSRSIEAKLEDGILRVTLPKGEQERARSIEVL